MKRGYEESSSSASLGPPQSRFRYNPEEDSRFLEDDSTDFARKVADHYSARTNQILEERAASRIIHLKKLNNWGGDLIKWDKAKIRYYVGVDTAEGSVQHPSP